MSFKKLYLIQNRENRQYFAGFSGSLATWATMIENAHPYYSQKDATEDYEKLKALGFDVLVEG